MCLFSHVGLFGGRGYGIPNFLNWDQRIKMLKVTKMAAKRRPQTRLFDKFHIFVPPKFASGYATGNKFIKPQIMVVFGIGFGKDRRVFFGQNVFTKSDCY